MPRLSVVVPIYNVEEYLEACLDSIAAQTFRDLEVVLVDDGATDSSPEIAKAYAERDPRFKVVHRPNGGLSAARNTGIEHATGDYLAFVDSDDLLLPDAYERLVGTLEATGSDFSTGKVLRLMGATTKPARFLSTAFKEERLKTHITRFRPLLADRIAWNKVFRRPFWDAQGLRFPEGRINEDIPVILPMHFAAKAVDVIAEPVYLWRFRDTGELSITERRAEPRALLMRLQAVSDVRDHLRAHGPRRARAWYDRSLVADDLKYYLNVLDRAGDEYRELFLDRVNALLDDAGDRIYSELPAIERLKWHLVRRRMLPEILEVLRFQREDLPDTAPIKRGRHWYGDYPFRGDARLGIPDRIYRLGPELTFTARIESLERDGERLRVRGLAFVDGVGAPAQGYQRVRAKALAPGPLRRVRLILGGVRLRTTVQERPDANAVTRNRVSDASWSGFEATLDVARLRRRARRRPEATWDLYLAAHAPGVTRRRVRFFLGDLLRPRAVELPSPPGVLTRALPTLEREVRLEVRTRWAAVTGATATEDGIEIHGEAHGIAGDGLRLELRGLDATGRLRRPLALEGERFSSVVPFERLLGAAGLWAGHDEDDDDGPEEGPDDADEITAEGEEDEQRPEWELYVIGAGRPLRVALPEAVGEASWPCAERELGLVRTPQGDAMLTLAHTHTVLSDVAWTPDGDLRVAGTVAPSERPQELVLASLTKGVAQAVSLGDAATGGPFAAELSPGALTSLAGTLPIAEGRWRLWTREAGVTDPDELVPVKLPAALLDRLPLAGTASVKQMHVTRGGDGNAVLVVRNDLALDEAGPFNQRRLQETVYRARRSRPLTDTVIYSSFRGRQYSDSPRVLHEELVRRDVPLEHLWVVKDGAAEVPPTARVLRDGSREAYEAFSSARYVVANDHFPEWFARRDDQICVQTWHGTPLKRLGFDVSRLRGSVRKFEHHWDEHERNWQYVVSPNRFATPILRQAYRLTGEILETGYPRDDVLAGAEREERSRALRRRLGIPDGVRTILYAPTFRDHVRDGRGRYRLDLRLDLERLRDAAGPDTVILFRKHHYIVDAVPTTGDGFVRDVSDFPDGTELLLAADVLVTDYSSMTVDFANTGRPMLFFTYDIDTYRDEVRGFYVDFEETVPGPLLRTTDELADAIRDLDAVTAAHAGRYEAFLSRFCELDDGGAAARVVDRVFADVTDPVGSAAPTAPTARGPA